MAIQDKIISFWKQVRVKSSDMFTKFKVGIGVKVPTHKLHVKDTVDPMKLEGVQSDTSSSTKFLVLDSSNVIKHSEGSGKTTEQVQDIVGAMFTGNTETNITATYEDSDGTIDLVATNTQLTNEQVQDIVGAMFTSNTETRISATYEDGDGTIDLVVDDMTADTNTNLGNTNLTASGTRTYDIDGNSLDFQHSSNSIFKIEEDNVSFGTGASITEVNFKFGSNTPSIQIYEASGSGTNYIRLTCGALASNRILTMPDATGTIALTSDISNTNLANTNLTADGDRTFNINANTVKFQNNTTTYLQLEDGAMILGGGGDDVSFKRDSGSASARVRFYEPPTDGSNYAHITTPALGSNITLTLPTSTGTFALTSDIAANTNIANTNLTADDNRTLNLDSNDLTFSNIGDFTATAQSFNISSGASAPDFRIYEASGSGTNYVKITLGALASNKTLTIPDATGTIALTSDLDHDALTNFVAAEHYRWDTDISATATINAANIPTLNQNTTGNAATATTAQGITGATDGDVTITSDGHVTVKLDADNDESNQRFKITNNSDATVFHVQEDGNVLLAGNIITNSSSDNDLTLETDGSLTFTIDRDNDESSQKFSFVNYNTEIANLDESGNLNFHAGSVNNGTITATRRLFLQHGSTYDVSIGDATNTNVLQVQGSDQKITVNGTIELGHASDTTIARSAAGTVTIEGNTIATTNKWIDAKTAAYWSSSTSGFYITLSGASTSENTSLTTASYTLMYTVPYDGKIIRISSFHQSSTSGTSTFEMYIDGDDSDLVNDQRGSDMTTSSYGQKFTEDCPADWTFSKGEAIAIKRTDSVAKYGVTMTIVFEYDTTT